jgi:hypothetical protein
MKNKYEEEFNVAIAIGLITTLAISMFYIGFNCGTELKNEPCNEPVIIWNDDIESIPTDGTLVKIEMTVNDTIYIGNVE